MAGQADLLGGLGGMIGSIVGYDDTGHNREQAQEDFNSALGGYQELKANQAGGDLQSRMAQSDALRQLRGIYSQGGMDAQARAAYSQAQNAANQNAAQMNAGVQNRMAQQGMASSGANFAAQQSNAQAAANQANQAGIQAAGQANARGQAAAGQAGELSSRMAQQNNALAQFNAAQQNQMSMGRAQGMEHAYDQMAGDQYRQAQEEMNFANGLGSGVGGFVGGVADSGDIGGQLLNSGQLGSLMGGGGGSGGGGGLMSLASMFG